jgi:hypothetical protein
MDEFNREGSDVFIYLLTTRAGVRFVTTSAVPDFKRDFLCREWGSTFSYALVYFIFFVSTHRVQTADTVIIFDPDFNPHQVRLVL